MQISENIIKRLSFMSHVGKTVCEIVCDLSDAAGAIHTSASNVSMIIKSAD